MREALSNPLVRLVAGFTIWSGSFVLLYTLQALGCIQNWGEAHRPIMIGAFVLCLLPLAALAFRQRPSGSESLPSLEIAALWANRAALGAGVLTYLPVLFATTCI